MKINITTETPNNKKFLFDLSESDTDVGLFFISSMSANRDQIYGHHTYEVIDNHLFMLAVMKHEITFEIIKN